jgi:hypothetical protein
MSARRWRKTLANRNDQVRRIDQSRLICFGPSTIKRRIIDITFGEGVSLADDLGSREGNIQLSDLTPVNQI